MTPTTIATCERWPRFPSLSALLATPRVCFIHHPSCPPPHLTDIIASYNRRSAPITHKSIKVAKRFPNPQRTTTQALTQPRPHPPTPPTGPGGQCHLLPITRRARRGTFGENAVSVGPRGAILMRLVRCIAPLGWAEGGRRGWLSTPKRPPPLTLIKHPHHTTPHSAPHPHAQYGPARGGCLF